MINKEIFEEYLSSINTIAAEEEYEDFKFVIDTIESFGTEIQNKLMKCINIAVEAGVNSRL